MNGPLPYYLMPEDSSEQRYRAVFISDIHLGTAGCQAEELLDFLKSFECETLYLVGDIVDGWQLKRRWHWPQAHNDVVQKILRKAVLFQYNFNLSVHGARKVSTTTIPRSEAKIKQIISAAISIASAKEPIFAWLREQCLLTETFLFKIVPLQQCPNDWPLGWKLTLETAIENLKSSDKP